MKKIFLIFIFISQLTVVYSQNEKMTNEKLDKIIKKISEEVEGTEGKWQFLIDSTLFLCLTDENNNRMRVISPIIESSKLTDKQIQECMEANFHTMLDSKYAISDGILWSVYIHPLKELTEEQVLSGIFQVYSGVHTFGTYYSSGLLSFPKPDELKEDSKEENKEDKKKKKSKKSKNRT